MTTVSRRGRGYHPSPRSCFQELWDSGLIMYHRMSHALFGVSTALSGATVLELLRGVNWVAALPAAGSIIAAVVSWILARRSEITRQTIELEHAVKQAKRDEQLAELLHELKVRQIESGQYPQPTGEAGK